jgi:4-diphosphocytidyl-2-C-methyl-D-erythritol kinase
MSRLPAPAKINLSLEVTGRRDDGFHDLVSVMQTVSLADTLRLGLDAEVRFSVSDPRLRENNLVERAAHLLREHGAGDQGCRIHLHKCIPAAAGLGGGSSDAASALVGLNRLWQLGLSCEQLLPLAERLGSDVPFFLYGGTCLVEGRGERVSRLPDPAASWYLLVNPRAAVSTAEVFAALEPGEWSDGSATRTLAAEIERGVRGGPGRNGLQEALFRVCPAASHCFEIVNQVVARPWVTGTGPTVVSQFNSEMSATQAMAALEHTGYWMVVVVAIKSVGRDSPCV